MKQKTEKNEKIRIIYHMVLINIYNILIINIDIYIKYL